MNNKLYSFINIIGLSIGLACILIIFLFVEFELSFDKSYPNNDQIYRIVSTRQNVNNTNTEGATSFIMGYSLRNDFPDYKIATSYMSESQDVLIDGNIYREKNVFYVDSVFCDIFEFDWIKGSPELIYQHPKNIAISESIVRKYFGEEDPIGKSIILPPNGSYQVAAVIKDFPIASSINFSIMLSTENLTIDLIGFDFNSWGTTISGFETYFKLSEFSNTEVVEKQINDIILSKYTDEENVSSAANTHYSLQKLRDVHLEPDFKTKPNTYTTSIITLWIYSFIGLLIICIAGINFINLTTAQGLTRAKEVGVRKVLGANKSQLRFGFISEFAFTSFLSMIVAIIIIEVVLPYINVFLGNYVELGIYNSRLFFGFIAFLFVFVNVLTSIYPSFVMSKVVPIIALKGNLLVSKTNMFSLRNALLVFQFTISIALISGTMLIRNQMNYINNKDLGFDMEGVIQFSVPDTGKDKLRSIRDFLKAEPGVNSFGFGLAAPSSSSNIRTSFQLDDDDPQTRRYMNIKPVNLSYLDVFKLNLLSGQWIFETSETDTIIRVVVNEQLYKVFGIKDEFEAISKKITIFGGTEATIIGVVQDFHSYSLRSKKEPLAFADMSNYFYKIFVDVEDSRKMKVIANITEHMSNLFPENFIESQSVSESISNMYKEENKTSSIISVLSALAIFIAALGLFGIVSFMLVQRIKEIGIRKVLGASLQQLAYSLTRTYLIIILISSFIAIPISWYFMNRWLNEFEYRINIGIWTFVIATLFTIFISMLTILYHVLKASKMNPVEALKYE